MELTTATRTWIIERLVPRLSGGAIVFLDGLSGRRTANRLVEITLPSPAFAVGAGEAIAFPIPTVQVTLSGTVGWAQLLSEAGEPLATLTVSDAPGADITINRLDVQRGGDFTLSQLVLRLPATN